MSRVLVIGGYGVFGSRVVERLAVAGGFAIIIAGRNGSIAREYAGRLTAACSRSGARATLEWTTVDAATLSSTDIVRLRAAIVIHTAGPFQGQDYRVARAALGAGAHYIDLADGRAFVNGIAALDRDARDAGVLVVSGASSVPALAAAVIDHLAADAGAWDQLVYGISPGNSFDPGPATVAAILGSVGRPFRALVCGRWQTVHGWQPLLWRDFPGLGRRLFGACDVPDLDLFPQHYPALRTQRFVAGVEVRTFHLAIYALSWLVRLGLLRHGERLAAPLLALKRRRGRLGTDRGVMFVELSARNQAGRSRTVAWQLIAEKGHGPYIPAIPAVILAKRLVAGSIHRRGALACVGLFDLDAFNSEVADLSIHQMTSASG